LISASVKNILPIENVYLNVNENGADKFFNFTTSLPVPLWKFYLIEPPGKYENSW